MGAVNSVRKLTIDSIALLEQLEPNGAELVAKRAVRRRVQQLLQQNWPTCRVLAFGSSESGLGFGGCDVDLGIYFEDMDVDAQGQFSPQERVDLLATACERLSTAFQVQEFVRNARVPVIKLWDPKRQVACDVCVGGINALLNTALLKYYGRVDPRVRPLVFAIKYWAKQRGINDSVNGTLSSYGYTLLLIFYLQSHYAEMQLPAVLSLFQDLQSQTKVSMLLERLQSLPTMELPSTFGTSEFNSVGALLAGFFDFYARRFNMEDEVVSIRMGRALSKTTKWSHPVSWRLSIEDPFELAHDVGRVIFHRKGQDLIRSEFKRASDLLSGGHRLGDVCVPDETTWNIMSTCYICRGRDHVTRDCGQLVRQRLTPGGGSNTMLPVHFSDCWYCGEYGHYKAECPMLFFRDIPRPVEVAKADNISAAEVTSESGSVPLVGFAPPSPPIAIPLHANRLDAVQKPRICIEPAIMSVRRNVRLRREYLYRKGLEGKERALYDHKQQLKEAIRSGKAIPTELRSVESKLRQEMEYDDEAHEKPLNHIDDEYKNAGMFDPKIAITTSRDPSSRLKQFAQEIRLIFPNAIRLNRGAHTIGDLVESARSNDFTDLLLVTETRGEPDGLVVCHLPYGPTAYFSLSNTVLRHDIEDRATISEAYPHLIINQFETPLGKRVANILKHLFPVPKPDAKRVITLSNDNDFVSFRHHVFKVTGREVELQECGPRFELQLYQVKLGTLDQKEAENEWVLRPYMNSAKKRRVL
ncbi:hypothetical protein JG688_00007774 [Phytophthora aleatoria]|uniref:Uncharacterized protein n=2 Tax=Phytophthora TaxID=4783 RepID=A0A8J5M518_9STRA|nr:hypothetical protein JG688_00007774 [Phytophthora aleatoria]